MNLSVEDGAVKLNFSSDSQPIVQNVGPGDLYLGTTGDDLIATGLFLPPFAVYEFPATLVDGAGAVWIQADGDTCDVRIINVG